MKTKYNIGETVLVKYTVKRIYADDRGIEYELKQIEGSDFNVHTKESDIYGSLPQNVQKSENEDDKHDEEL